MNTAHRPRLFPASRQDGLALIVALIALVAMSLAGVALIRSVDTNSLVASNMTFRQTARESTDAGIEAARTWLMTQSTAAPTSLQADSGSYGYYAMRSGLDLTGNDAGTDIIWRDNDGSSTAGTASSRCLAADAGGNVVCYVIQRMCDAAGPMSKDSCDVSVEPSDPSRTDLLPLPGGIPPDPPPEPVAIYRVTVRAAGPRNNLSYTQVFIAV